MKSSIDRAPAESDSLNPQVESFQRPPKIARTKQDHSDEEGEGENQQSMSKSPRTQRYLVAIEYFGTRFFGSQKQPKCRTVVGTLEDAFQKFIGQPVSIICSSRTDAGVHALSNVCHVDVERISKRKPGEVLTPHEPSVVRRAVNHFLQKNERDIMVVDVRCVPSDFHARYKAQERTYYYRLLSGPEPLSTFERDQAWHVPEELDLHAMQEACKVLVGRHDFSSFRAAGCQASSPVRTLDELHVLEAYPAPSFLPFIKREQKLTAEEFPTSSKEFGTHVVTSMPMTNGKGASIDASLPQFGIRRRHRCLVVTARSRSFLYHQVRLLVGVLKCVGTGNLTVSDVARILDAKTVTAASPMAPPYGLYLGCVKYDLP